MKLIIAGSRKFNLDFTTVQNLFDLAMPEDSVLLPDAVVSGTCRGVDVSGENWAAFQDIPVKRFKPDWDGLGRKAGPIRNEQMAEYGDTLLLIWDGNPHSGSANMRSHMVRLGKPVYEVIIRGRTN